MRNSLDSSTHGSSSQKEGSSPSVQKTSGRLSAAADSWISCVYSFLSTACAFMVSCGHTRSTLSVSLSIICSPSSSSGTDSHTVSSSFLIFATSILPLPEKTVRFNPTITPADRNTAAMHAAIIRLRLRLLRISSCGTSTFLWWISASLNSPAV